MLLDGKVSTAYFETLTRASIYGAAYVRGLGELGLSTLEARRYAAATLASYVMLPEVSLEQLILEGAEFLRDRAHGRPKGGAS